MRCHADQRSCPRRRNPVVGKRGVKPSPTRARQQRVLGCAICVIVTRPVVGGHALRASRSSHERRECARCARDSSRPAVAGCAAGGDRLTSMRWCRTSCLQARRCSLRLQSREAAAVRDPPGADAAAHSPDEASRSRCHPIDTARAADRGGSGECWPHRPGADCHRQSFAAPGGEEAFLLDSAASHQAEEESRLL